MTLVRLTQKGRDLKPDFDEISETLLQRVYRDFTPQEKDAIIYGLEKLLKNI